MRCFAFSAFFVAVLASTCNAPPATQPAQTLPFRVVTLLPPPGGAPFSYAEPTLAINDRTILVVAATANVGVPPTFWISRNAGASWTAGANFDNTGSGTGDADVAIGTDGELYALNLGSNNPPGQPTNPTVFVFHSADGVAWSGPATFPLPHGLDQPDRPWLFTDPAHPERVNVVHNEGGGNVVLWRSTDHAASFQGPITVTGGANGQAALELSSRPLFDPTDAARIYVLYETANSELASGDSSGGEFPITQVWLALSTDAGASWSNTLVLDSSSIGGGTLAHLLVASTIDSAGRLFAAFSLRPSGSTETHLLLMHSIDHGITWSAPSQVDSVLASNVMPAIAAGAGGALFVSWYASSSPDFQDTNAVWREEFAQTMDALAARPTFTETNLSGPGPVHVGDMNMAGNPGFQAGKNWGLRDLQSIAVDGCGLPHPVWAVDFNGTSTQTAVPSAACMPAPAQLMNISTREQVQGGDKVAIAGFIITASDPQRVLLRAIAPSMNVNGAPVAGRLMDPTLELHDKDGALITTNDNWKDAPNSDEIQQTGIAPSDDRESAILQLLAPAKYTAVMRGKDGSTGIGLVEAYDLIPKTNSQLANISTRGVVETNDNVLIGGFIAGPNDRRSTAVVVRALGPTLAGKGVSDPLQDPMLELHDQNGGLIASNDDWAADPNADKVAAAGLAPDDPRESVIYRVMTPAGYTAIVRGKANTSGVALVEGYNVQ